MATNRTLLRTLLRLTVAAVLLDVLISAVHFVLLRGNASPIEAYALVPLFIVGILLEANLHPERYRAMAAQADNDHTPEHVVVNPASGRVMLNGFGGVDTAGNPYGIDLSRRD